MDFWFLVDALFLLAGCYLISLGVKVKLSGNLKDLQRVMPKYAHPGRCLDSDGFIRAILPWLILLGFATALNGLLSMLQDLGLSMPDIVHWASLAFFVLAAVLFLKMERDAVGRFWSEENQPDQLSEQARKAKREAKKAKKAGKGRG